MGLDDRLFWLAIGCVLGFFVGYMVRSLRVLQEIKAELDEVDSIVKEEQTVRKARKRRKDNADGWMSNRVAADISMGVVVVLVVWSAFAAQKNSNDLEDNVKQDKINSCESGIDSRTVQRQTVDAVYELASGSLTKLTPKEIAALTPEQVVRYNAFVDDINKFRTNMYAKIQPSDRCKGLVPEESKTPPTPSIPQLTTPPSS